MSNDLDLGKVLRCLHFIAQPRQKIYGVYELEIQPIIPWRPLRQTRAILGQNVVLFARRSDNPHEISRSRVLHAMRVTFRRLKTSNTLSNKVLISANDPGS